DTNLWSAALDGTDPIAHANRAGWTFAVDDENVYATTRTEALVKTALGGGTSSDLADLSVSGIAPVGSNLYLAAGGPLFDSTIEQNGIWRVPRDGGAPFQLIVDEFGPAELVVYGNGVYWTDEERGLRRANLDGTNVMTIDGNRSSALRILDGRLFYLRHEDPGADFMSV